MLDKNQLYIVGQALNALRSGKYQWERRRVAYDMFGRPCEVESHNAGYFDIFGIIGRVNFDNGHVATRLEPIFEECKKAIAVGSFGDTSATNLQLWNDSPATSYADVLLVLDTVRRSGKVSTSAYSVAVAAE